MYTKCKRQLTLTTQKIVIKKQIGEFLQMKKDKRDKVIEKHESKVIHNIKVLVTIRNFFK